MKRFNWLTAPLAEGEDAPERFRSLFADIAGAIGAEHLGGQLAQIPPGRAMFPYHWEAGQEEWLIVLAGTPTVRTPEGEQQLREGDVACFAAGPDGAHQVLNHTDADVRVVMFSNRVRPNAVFYPDSGKVGIRTVDGRLMLAQQPTLGYWEGES